MSMSIRGLAGPQAVTDRFSGLTDCDAVRIAGRYIAEDRFELTRFEP